MPDMWFDFKKTPITDTLNPVIIFTDFDELAIVYWLVNGWNGPHWYSADEEHYYTDENILYWMKSPKPPKKLTTTVPTCPT
jgi:hypothetical protein